MKKRSYADTMILPLGPESKASYVPSCFSRCVLWQVESELKELESTEAAEFLASLGATESGLSSLIRTSYQQLGLRTYFTTGAHAASAGLHRSLLRRRSVLRSRCSLPGSHREGQKRPVSFICSAWLL